MLALEYRPRADLDRQSVAIYLGQELGNPQATLKAIRAIDTAIESVRLFPSSGKALHFEGTPLEHEYRVALAGQYAIYYRHDDSTVTACRILHQRRDIDTYTLVNFE